MKSSLLVCGDGEGESFDLVAAREWGGGQSLTLGETQSWMNVCAERLRRACHGTTVRGEGEDVAQACVNQKGGAKWVGA